MGFTFFGLLLLSVAHQYGIILVGGVVVGLGSVVLDPGIARMARLASGRALRLCAIGVSTRPVSARRWGGAPAALIVVPFGQPGFSSISFLAIVIRGGSASGTGGRSGMRKWLLSRARECPEFAGEGLSPACFNSMCRACRAITLHPSSMNLASRRRRPALSHFAANVVGAFFGGPRSLGANTSSGFRSSARCRRLALPYAGLFGSAVLTVFIGLILSSATSSIIVFAQETHADRFGMISGWFLGVAFGSAGTAPPQAPTTPASPSFIRSAPSSQRCRRPGPRSARGRNVREKHFARRDKENSAPR